MVEEGPAVERLAGGAGEAAELHLDAHLEAAPHALDVELLRGRHLLQLRQLHRRAGPVEPAARGGKIFVARDVGVSAGWRSKPPQCSSSRLF